MKIQLYDECKEKKNEEPLILRLVAVGNKVTLAAVNKDGSNVPSGNILTITAGGTLRRCSGCRVPQLQLDGLGKIKQS